MLLLGALGAMGYLSLSLSKSRTENAQLAEKQQVLIEGVRIIKKHVRKSQDNPQGAILEREGPIHISNVKLVEPEKTGEKKASKAKSKSKKKS